MMKHIKKYLSFVLFALVLCVASALFVFAFTAIIAALVALSSGNFVKSIIMFLAAIVLLFIFAAILDLAEWMNQKGWFY